MSRARRAPSSPVQLFPFLAVLVSTIGALILLLLAINRQVTQQAIARAAAARADEADAREQLLQRERDRAEIELDASRRRARDFAAQHATLVQSVESRRRETRSARERVQSFDRQLHSVRDQRNRLTAAIAATQEEIAAIEDTRRRKPSQPRTSETTFVPVVHPGAHGTVRQPIYIECNAAGITFQPEGVALSLHELYHDPKAVAAFARIVRSLAQYHSELSDRAGESIENEAYPLFLVRPDGIPAYYCARVGLIDSEFPFGYELLEPDWQLQFPEHDAAARRVAEAARSAGPAGPGSRAIGMVARGAEASRASGSAEPLRLQLVEQRGSGSAPSAGMAGAGRGLDGSEIGGGAASPRDSSSADRAERAAAAAAVRQSLEHEADAEVRAMPVGGARETNRANAGTDQSGGAAQHEEGSSEPSGADEAIGDLIPTARLAARRIPIRRRIEVECYRERLVVRSGGTAIRINEREAWKACEQLWAEVEREMARWGPAGTTFFWQPEIVCLVRGGSLATYYGLRQGLLASGVAIDHVIVLEADDVGDGWLFLDNSELE